MGRQQGDKHAKASDSKIDIEQPGQQLKRVRGPAPAIGPGAERHVSSLWDILSDRYSAVQVPAAHIHPAHRENIFSQCGHHHMSSSI